ncbi:MAG: hypothetical protein VKK04_03410 [Synechococcales bacterium]|nr:hypothetical protein [Synechococcales bacterium]
MAEFALLLPFWFAIPKAGVSPVSWSFATGILTVTLLFTRELPDVSTLLPATSFVSCILSRNLPRSHRRPNGDRPPFWAGHYGSTGKLNLQSVNLL